MKDLFDRIEALEEQVTHVKRGLSDLLEEDDVKDLPSYGLLKQVYVEFLNSKPERSKTSEQKQDEMYDPLYAPPTTRKRNSARAKKQMVNAAMGIEIPKVQTVPNPLQPRSNNTPSFMPDFSENLLEKMDKPKSQAKKPILVKVRDNDTVYTVEIQGKKYLRHDKYLYDMESKLRAGSIEDGFFSLDGCNPVQFQTDLDTLLLSAIPDTEYYKSDDNRLFVRVNDEADIYQGVGEMTPEGDIGLWE